ncbi:hypothetical protein DFH06DRAFT_1131206 [Mycena polygramma]|nr:hypothetical protein DFH06DRAFT_1131206 [Mycena polygramma]
MSCSTAIWLISGQQKLTRIEAVRLDGMDGNIKFLSGRLRFQRVPLGISGHLNFENLNGESCVRIETGFKRDDPARNHRKQVLKCQEYNLKTEQALSLPSPSLSRGNNYYLSWTEKLVKRKVETSKPAHVMDPVTKESTTKGSVLIVEIDTVKGMKVNPAVMESHKEHALEIKPISRRVDMGTLSGGLETRMRRQLGVGRGGAEKACEKHGRRE